MYVLPVGMMISVMWFVRHNIISATDQDTESLFRKLKYIDLQILIKKFDERRIFDCFLKRKV